MSDLPSNFLERTATLDEVLGPEFITVEPGETAFELDDAFWNKWRHLTGNGDQRRFQNRITSSGWDEQACVSRLRGFRRIIDNPPPYWALTAKTLHLLFIGRGTEAAYAPDEANCTPFIELITPVLTNAQLTLERLLLSDGFPQKHAVQLSALATTSLRQSLVDLLGPVLFSLFKQHRQQLGKPNIGRDAYIAFVLRMQKSGYRQLFEARPLLLRLLATVHDQWLFSMQEFLLRLRRDLKLISNSILAQPIKCCLDDVKDFEFGLSDLHNEGRSVIIVVLRDHQKFVYKPKDLRPEANLTRLMTLLHNADTSMDLRVPRCSPQHGYGWMEFIENLSCNDLQQIESYYRRAGAWLAIFHVLDGSDIHDENLIACGDQPVPIDFEVLFQGGKAVEHAEDAFHIARDKIRHTVLSVGMLPTYARDHNQLSFESGGLQEGKSRTKTLVWSDLNTDQMNLDIVEIGRLNRANLPRLGEVFQQAREFQEFVVFGFESCMNLLMKLQKSLAMAQTLEGFKTLKFRKVYRPTYFYYYMLERLRDFKNWRNGLVWSVEVEFLFRLVDWDSVSARNLSCIANAEKQALLKLNIPHFTKTADGVHTLDGDGIDLTNNDIDGFSLVCARLSTLSSQDIERETYLIRLALSHTTPLRSTQPKEVRNWVGKLDSPFKIAEFVAKQAIRHRGTAAWLGLDWHADIGKSQLVVLGQDFYNGNGGIAIFLAAAAKLLKKADLAELAYEAITPVRKSLSSAEGGRLVQGSEIGGGVGLTSYLYVLTTLSELLEDASLMFDAEKLVQQINGDLIAKDKSFDVLAGSSGAILALLKYYKSHKDPRGLAMALKCGDHLLSKQETWRALVDNQSKQSKIQANGFAHGAAGISLALFHLARVSGRVDYHEAALKLVHFENASFSPVTSNWPDLRFRHLPDSTWACQWCHGAGGIGIARLCSAETLSSDIPTNRALNLLLLDVDRAISGVTSLDWPGPIDSLCCGNAGNVEFIKEVGIRLGRPELTKRAEIMFDSIIQRYRTEGEFAWSNGDDKLNVGLFRGLSGIGYSMLRSAHPQVLPNVLIWE